MLSEREVLSTFEMIKNEHLDVRTVTLGISLFDCASDELGRFLDNIYTRIVSTARDLVCVCDEIGDKYGIPVVNKRISISPMAVAGAPFGSEQMVEIARTLDRAAREVQIDFIGGFAALWKKAWLPGICP